MSQAPEFSGERFPRSRSDASEHIALEIRRYLERHGLQPGDRIMARGRKDPSTGRLIVTEILANWTSFSGSILSVSGSGFRVQVQCCPVSTFNVSYIGDTEFQASRPEDIAVGGKIDVAGLVQKDGSILATTVIVRDSSGMPTRMGQNARTLPRSR